MQDLRQDIKVANFQRYFAQTFQRCEQHLGPEESASFFVLMTSQLLAKMVRGMPATKQVTSESLSFLRTFVEHMGKHKCFTDMPTEMKLLQLMVDFNSAPPTQVLEEVSPETIAASSHWAIVPFASGPGKRIVECARDNAKRREVFAKVLEEVSSQAAEFLDSATGFQ